MARGITPRAEVSVLLDRGKRRAEREATKGYNATPFAGFRLGATAEELRQALEDAMKGIFEKRDAA